MGANSSSETPNSRLQLRLIYRMPETVPVGVSISCEIAYHCEHEFSVCSNATFVILREAERLAVDRLGRLPH